MIKFHVMSVWELLEEDLQAHNPFERGVLYNTYENWAFKGMLEGDGSGSR